MSGTTAYRPSTVATASAETALGQAAARVADSAHAAPANSIWGASRTSIAFWVVATVLFLIFSHRDLYRWWLIWDEQPELSFGFMIPAVVAFLIWQRKDRLQRCAFSGSYLGVALILVGIAVRHLGELALTNFLVLFGVLLVAVGIAWAHLGTRAIKVIWVPLLFLLFMLPPPAFLLQSLSSQLQEISSILGVTFIRLCNISVHLEGNIIDLGTMKLQVAEACSGLRYLFSLLVLGFISAYFFKGAFWKKAVIFLSAAPITVLMNSVRIGLVGVTVEYYGRSAAEGVLHDFEGLVIFLGAFGILLIEMWILGRIGSAKKTFGNTFGIDFPATIPAGTTRIQRAVSTAAYAGAAALAIGIGLVHVYPRPAHIAPPRIDFAELPDEFNGWSAKRATLDKIYLDILRVDDYLLADYTDSETVPVNAYIQYYQVQTRDRTVHSPRVCIPSAGWEIASLGTTTLSRVDFKGRPLEVNRAVIVKGDSTLLVYYWFQQRGRVSAHEYGTKLLILWDTLTRHRSDGAMVRLITTPGRGNSLGDADARLARFAQAFVPHLSPHIPD